MEDVSVFIDEIHHSQAVVSKEIGNKLGWVVGLLANRKVGSLTLATATWFRSDDEMIVSDKRKFARFELKYDDFLRRHKTIRKFGIRFVVGPLDECLAKLGAEYSLNDPTRPPFTGVYMPHVTSYLVGGKDKKVDVMKSYMATLLKSWKDKSWVDLVNPNGRKARLAKLVNDIAAKHPPRFVGALNMMKEGFDFPSLERSIVIGSRGSIGEMIQILGRLMRPDDRKKFVELDIVIPFTGKEDPEILQNYVKYMTASMFVYELHYRGPDLKSMTESGREAMKKLMEDEEKVNRLTGAVVDAACGYDGSMSISDTIRQAIRDNKIDVGSDSDEREVAEVVKRVFARNTMNRIQEIKDLGFDLEMTKSAFGCVNVFACQMGFKDLKRMREAIQKHENLPASQRKMRACQRRYLDLIKKKMRGLPESERPRITKHYSEVFEKIVHQFV